MQLPDERLPHLFGPVAVHFGEPRHLPAAPGERVANRRLRATTDELMHEIAELSRTEYVDTFA